MYNGMTVEQLISYLRDGYKPNDIVKFQIILEGKIVDADEVYVNDPEGQINIVSKYVSLV